MTTAVCVHCGVRKNGVFTKCTACDYMPETERELIYSLAFSDRHLGAVELDQLSRDIEAGAAFTLSKAEEDELRPAAIAYLERGGYLAIAKADAEKKAAAERRAQPWDHTRRIELKPAAPPAARPALLDLTDMSVRRLVTTRRSRGYVTLDEINGVLPSSYLSPDEIESVMTALSDMGIIVVESEEHIPKPESQPQREGMRRQQHRVVEEIGPETLPAPTSRHPVIQTTDRKLTLKERAAVGFAWFIVGGFAVALVTLIPAQIVGFHEHRYEQFVYLCALVIGIGGAIYGRIPWSWK